MQEAQAPLPAGTVIHEHYVIESLLGKGDFGSVYLVQDQRGEQELFALAEVINATEQARYGFALDYVSLANLDQRILPHVQYVFNDDKRNRSYVLMQYIEESNLELLRLQQAEKRFPFSEVKVLMNSVMQAVIHLHHRPLPVLHRNIQPATIIMPQGVDAPVLVMLEVVKEYDETSTTLPYFASGYGAPEQYKGESSTRTDIYELGATWYTLITGIIPSDAILRSTRLSKGESDPVKPINEVIPAIPLFIAGAIQRAMSIHPEDRFSSVEQFWEAVGSPERQPLPGLSHPPLSTLSPELVLMPKLPDTPHPGKLNGSVSGISKQADERHASVPVPEPLPASRRPLRSPYAPKLSVVFIILALLISLGIGAGFLSHTRSLPVAHSTRPASTVIRPPPPVPTATYVPSSYPRLAGTYIGTIADISSGVSTSMSLTGIRQSQGNIGGYLVLGPKMPSSGPFSGTVDIAKHIQFIVTDTTKNAIFFFEGDMRSGGLTGDYYRCRPASPARGSRCSQASDNYGIWDVVLTS